MEQRDSFIFYRSFYEALRQCPDDVRLQLYDAISEYALNVGKTTPEFTGVGAALWILIEPQLRANNNRYINGKKGGKFGVMGGAPKGNTNAKKEQTETKTKPKQPQVNPKTTPNENENVNVNENVNEVTKLPNTRARAKFVKPTLQEVQEYVAEKGYDFDPETFIAHYESNGWKVGRNPMVSWKASCANWNSREKKQYGQGTSKGGHPTDAEVVRNTYELIAEAASRPSEDNIPF